MTNITQYTVKNFLHDMHDALAQMQAEPVPNYAAQEFGDGGGIGFAELYMEGQYQTVCFESVCEEPRIEKIGDVDFIQPEEFNLIR